MVDRTDRFHINLKLAIIDLLVIVCVYVIAYLVTPARHNSETTLSYALMLPSFCVIYFLLMTYYRMYNNSTFFYTDRVVKNTAYSFVITSVLVFIYLFLAHNTTFSRLFLVLFFFSGVTALVTEKMILLKHKKILSSRVNVIYVSYMGGNNEDLYENFQRYAQLSGFNFNVVQNIKFKGNSTNEVTGLEDLINFEKTLRRQPCDQVIFAQSLTEKWDLAPFLRITNEMGIVTRVLYDVYPIDNYRWYISTLGLFPMLTYYNVVISPFSLFIKRLMDIIGSLAGIVLSSPIMIITAIAIKIDTPGPVFFKQERIGLNRKKFYMLKFRSMVKDAEKYKKELIAQNEMGDTRLFKIKNDPRITKVGKIIRRRSIDELPQFFNVLKGEMSLVGTRPPTVFEVEQYDRHHYRRISMKPGITGIWQTSGRNKIKNFEKIVQMDTDYIDNWSLLLDIKLIFKTIKVLLNKEGAY